MLNLLQTPAEILPGAELYLRIMFGGIPVLLFYNLLASILRSLGDGKTPLYAMILAALSNILLDLDARNAYRSGVLADLTAKEFDLLLFFMKNANAAL